MPKIIVLNGGPRKNGNTFRIAQWVMEGAASKGADIEVIHLIDFNIQHCIGCSQCAVIGKCVLKDDHEDICKILDSAKGLIVCSPVYAGSSTSLFKAFEHRIANIIGFTGRYSHLCSVGITTGDFDFRRVNAKMLAGSINTAWESPGYISGYIHKSKIDHKRHLRITIDRENNPKLYKRAVKLGEKLVSDIDQGRKGKLPVLKRVIFKRIVLPGIAKVIENQKGDFEYLYDLFVQKGYIKAT